jgi:DNA-binding transcriptional MerR regulator
VGLVLVLRDVGFSLAEIHACITSRARSPAAWGELARDKVAELDERIARAQVAGVALEHSLRCTHDDLSACPNFAAVLAARLDGTSVAEGHRH